MNRKAVTFENVPFYYSYAVVDGVDLEKLKAANISIDSLSFESKAKEETQGAFFDGLVRQKQVQKLFPKAPEPIQFIEEGFFRTQFYIPSNVPTGVYTIKSLLLDERGQVRDMHETSLNIAHVGASATIFNFAHDWSFLYGVLCVLFAVSVGWFANAVRRRLS